MPLVSQRDVNHSHQRFLEEGPITLSVILLEHLTATVRAHWENQPPAGLQLLQELKQEGQKKELHEAYSAQSARMEQFGRLRSKLLYSLQHFTSLIYLYCWRQCVSTLTHCVRNLYFLFFSFIFHKKSKL